LPHKSHTVAAVPWFTAGVVGEGYRLFDNRELQHMAILQDVSKTNGKAPSNADLLARLAQLEAENAKLKEARHKTLSMKVSEKGACSVYGLGRFPVTLYRGQWERLIEAVPQIKAFIEANASTLTTKD
jgi:hypothetical protein